MLKRIFSIYRNDINQVMKNWAVFVTIIGLMILPSIYAWFTITSSWDPYGNTNGLVVAVVNEDKGTTFQSRNIRIGDEIVAALKNNNQLGWRFVSASDALYGVEHGTYYASITIPADFSEKIMTILNDNPIKPEIVYEVNEKINAIAPKITETGASNIVHQVSQNFIKTASGVIFHICNELGVQLQENLPMIEKVIQYIFRLESEFPTIENFVNIALTDVNKADDIVANAKDHLSLLLQLTQSGMNLTNGLTQFLKTAENILPNIMPNVKMQLMFLKQLSEGVIIQTNMLSNQSDALQLSSLMEQGITIMNGLIQLFTQLQQISPSPIFNKEIGIFTDVKNNFQSESSILKQFHQESSPQVKQQLQNLSISASRQLADVLGRYDTEISPSILTAVQKAVETSSEASRMLQDANNALPDVKKILDDSVKGLAFGKDELKRLQQNLPGYESRIKGIANRIREFEATTNIHEVIRLLRLDMEKESDFLANPVLLQEKKLFPIPNYGSAMSPFFTTLSLWVGALLLVSLLSVYADELALRSYELYFGRLLTFGSIALFQALIVTMGDIFLLHTYVLHKGWFIIFGVFTSIIFTSIVYTLVSLFGNIGKAISILFLVLQISGSGGTFPIQVTPKFFQKIYPFLPFSYGISLMREAVGGILWDIVLRDVFYLCTFAGLFILLGFLLKSPLNKIGKSFVSKTKESKLIE